MPVRRLVLAFIFIVIVGIAAVLIWQGRFRGQQGEKWGGKSGQGWGQRPGGMEQYSLDTLKPKAKPPSEKVSVYKGFWLPCSFMEDSCQPMNDIKILRTIGTNIVGIAPNIKINEKGEIKAFPLDYFDQRLNEITARYYQAGIRVFMSPELDYSTDLNSRSQGAPQPIPKGVAATPGFMDKYDVLVEDFARLAEKYQFEFFSPLNEADMKLGNTVASSWGQKILPQIKSNYKGKVLWKVGLGVDPQIQQINFRGYDILGIDFTAPGGTEAQSLFSFPSIVKGAIENAKKVAKRDAVPEVILAEVGVWGGALNFSEEGKVGIHRIIFEQGKDIIGGFIILDPPRDLGGWTLKNSKSQEEIKSWFNLKL